MNRTKVAKELINIAKSITAVKVPTVDEEILHHALANIDAWFYNSDQAYDIANPKDIKETFKCTSDQAEEATTKAITLIRKLISDYVKENGKKFYEYRK